MEGDDEGGQEGGEGAAPQQPPPGTIMISQADELGLTSLVANCHAGLGHLYSRIDRETDAHEHLRASEAIADDLGLDLSLLAPS